MEKYGDDYGKTAESVVSSGPYVITDWKENEYVKFEARDDYYGDKPDLTHLKYVPVSDVNAAVVALQTGELDLYFNPLSGVALDTVKTADNVAISEASYLPQRVCLHELRERGILRRAHAPCRGLCHK